MTDNTQTQQQINTLRTLQESYSALVEAQSAQATATALEAAKQAILTAISNINIDTSDLAKEETLEEVSDKIGTPMQGQPSDLFAAIAAIGGGGGEIEINAYTVPAVLNATKAKKVTINNVSTFGVYYFFNGLEYAEELDLSQVSIVNDNSAGSSFLSNCLKLRSADLHNIQSIDYPNSSSNSSFNNLPFLSKIEMPAFIGKGGTRFIVNCPSLKRVQFGALTKFTPSQYDFAYCPLLIDIELGAETNIPLNFTGWNPTTALSISDNSLIEEGETFTNNREKLLYNIRTHIADKLADLTGQSSKTFSFSSDTKAAIQADTATSDAFTNKNWVIA